MDAEQQQDVNPAGLGRHAPTAGEAQPTNGSYFKRRNEQDKTGKPITIGDITFLVGRPSLASLTKQGIIPSELAAKATNIQQKAGKGRPLTTKEVEDLNQYQKVVLKSSLRSPQIVDENPNYESNQIAYEDLTDSEATELMMYVQGGDEALRMFRVERQRAFARFGSESLSDNEAE